MSFLTTILSPFNLLFFIIVAGFAFGKIRIHRISIGIAGILFIAILVGSLLNLFIPEASTQIIYDIQSTMKIFSKLGTSLFISAIGLQTGCSIKNNSKKSLFAFLIGAMMSISGVMLMLLILKLDKTISCSALLGILCGALTSTPGLSCVCEFIGISSEEATWGYGCSYPFGVIFAVLFAQLFTNNANKDCAEKTQNNTPVSKIYPELILISITALFGSLLGNTDIPILHISFGNTACTLLIGLMIGYIIKNKSVTMHPTSQTLSAFRNLGLALFFAGTGFSTGIQSISFDAKNIIYGALITLTAILCGLLLCKVRSLKHHVSTGFVIAGGMTSSPAYGGISAQANELSLKDFSFAYFGALVSLVVAIQFIKGASN